MRRLLLVLILSCLSTGGWCQERVSVRFEKATDPNLDRLRQHLEKHPYLVAVPKALDQFLELPRELPVVFRESGAVDASYSPGEHSVTVSYEIYATMVNLFLQAGHSPGKAVQLADAALVHILLHELGHAVIGELELPVTGAEEDCADEFATLLSSNALGPLGQKMAWAAAELFGLLGESPEIGRLPFWDEHSLSRQRYSKVLCDLNAALPEGVPGLDQEISPARLAQAKSRYPDKVASWMRQLSPHLVAGSSLKRLKPAPQLEGHLKAVLGSGNSDMTREMVQEFAAGSSHQRMVKDFDTMFLWPRDLTVRFTATGDALCRYDRETAELVLSLDFFEQVAKKSLAATQSQGETAKILEGVIGFTVLQEIGKALLYELDLPTTGEPEDVTAEFVMVLLSVHPQGQDWATQTAHFYKILADQNESLEGLWSPEAFSEEKFYDILGYLYGQDPVGFAYVERMMPESRLLRYQRDFVQKSLRWETLLKPYAQHVRLGN